MNTGFTWRLTLADDHPVILRGLKQLIEAHGEFTVVATAIDGFTAESNIRQLLPDIAVLDISMPGRNGMEILRSLTRDRVRTRIVLLTASVSDDMLVEAVRLGVQGLVLKEADAELLVDCLVQVAHGARWIAPSLARRAEEAVRDGKDLHPARELTQREVEIMHLVSEGCANRTIAERVGISEGTVKIHLHNIYQKTGVANRTELAGFSFRRRASAV